MNGGGLLMATFLLLGMLALFPSPGWAEPLEIRDLRPGDRAYWSDETLVLESSTGIGEVTLDPHGSWPESLTVRFVYPDGRKMLRLENLRISTQSESQTLRYPDPDPSSPDVAARLGFRDGTLEVTLSAPLLNPAESLTIQWIDAYR